MIGYIICFGLGMATASAVWFFVWRNNKDLIRKQAEKLDTVVTEKMNELSSTE